MKLVIQRVIHASCSIDNKIVGKCEKGYMILVGIGLDDNKDIVQKLASKVNKLRIFEDDAGKMNLSIKDVNGSILSISQFTLYADCKGGNRPSFVNAGKPFIAKELYLYFNECLRKEDIHVEEGIFGADMKIDLLNDGPVTIIMDSKEL